MTDEEAKAFLLGVALPTFMPLRGDGRSISGLAWRYLSRRMPDLRRLFNRSFFVTDVGDLCLVRVYNLGTFRIRSLDGLDAVGVRSVLEHVEAKVRALRITHFYGVHLVQRQDHADRTMTFVVALIGARVSSRPVEAA